LIPPQHNFLRRVTTLAIVVNLARQDREAGFS
jgi:hypothetical protein